MRISDWSSDVCSSDLGRWRGPRHRARYTSASPRLRANQSSARAWWLRPWTPAFAGERLGVGRMRASPRRSVNILFFPPPRAAKRNDSASVAARSEEHTSALQSLMRISYAVFCLKKQKTTRQQTQKNYKSTEDDQQHIEK